MNKDIITAGETVDIFLGTGPTYRTKAEAIDENGDIMITPPLYRGVPVILHAEEEADIYYYRPNGRYWIRARVIEHAKNGPVFLIRMRMLGEPRRQQRRQSFRLPIKREVHLRLYKSGPFPSDPLIDDGEFLDRVFTENISETGLSLQTVYRYDSGEKLYARVFLEWPTQNAMPIEVLCKIVQIRSDPVKNINSLGISFIDISNGDRNSIAKFVLTEQQKKIRREKWLRE